MAAVESMAKSNYWQRRLSAVRDQLAYRLSAPARWLRGNQPRPALGILRYQKIGPQYQHLPADEQCQSPQVFRKQLLGLLNRGYRAIPLSQAINHQRDGKSLPAKTFAITFDHGYECVFRNAWPILLELNIPATCLLATKYLDSDQPFPFDSWAAAGSPRAPSQAWKPLSTEQCRQMLASGLVELGSHSHAHEDFRTKPIQFEQDVIESKRLLAERFQLSDVPLAYPFGTRREGFVSAGLQSVVRSAGFSCGLTADMELANLRGSTLAWGRIAVHPQDSTSLLAARLCRSLLPAAESEVTISPSHTQSTAVQPSREASVEPMQPVA